MDLGKISKGGNAAYLGSNHAYLCASDKKPTFEDTLSILKDTVEIQEQGHAVDKEYPDIIYVPETSKFSMITQSVSFTLKGKEQKLNLKPRVTYVLPSGYKVEMVKRGSTEMNKGSGKKAAKSGTYVVAACCCLHCLPTYTHTNTHTHTHTHTHMNIYENICTYLYMHI